MATQENNLVRGSIGGWIYSVDPVTKKQVIRRKPKKVRNPQTPAQESHRAAFIDIVRLSSRMTEAHLIGLHRHAQRMKLRTYADFRHLNRDCFIPDGQIDYPRVVLSRGPVAPVFVRQLQLGDDGRLLLAFEPCLGQPDAAPDDELYLFVYDAASGAAFLAPPVRRSAGALDLRLPDECAGARRHIYAFLRDRKGRTSDTIYVPWTPSFVESL
ncbi:MAG: hypothetical protein II751_00740 [Bacteroidales bacterium]|nr:hypothetical protein [Bacteroidales bacterium]